MCQIESMSDADLLAMMVGIKAAHRMLKEASGSLSALLNDSVAAYDVAPKEQTKLRVAKELVRRSLMEVLRQRDCLSSPSLVRDFLRVTLEGREYEVFMVIYLDAQNKVLAVEEMFRGTLSQTSVYPREVVKRSLFYNAAGVLLSHNHPSGLASPSHADEALTNALKAALSLVDVKVLDHFIIGAGCAMSFAESGLL